MAAKKKWYLIVAPKMFDEVPVGETMALDPRQIIGRTVNVSLLNLTRDYSRFHIKMRFQIDAVEGDRATTKFTGHDIMREKIYRMVQRRSRRVDCVEDVITKDNKKIRVKTVFTLVRRVNTSIKNSCRAKAVEIIHEMASKATLEELIRIMINGDMQKKIKKDCGKVYPVGNVEIRKSELIVEKIKKEAQPETKEIEA